jgi:L-fucose isomerase
MAKNGFIHMVNSGASALDATGACVNEKGEHVMKKWYEMEKKDIDACLEAVDWCPADIAYFPGGGFSSHFKKRAEMPLTMARVNLIANLGPVLQIAEGWSIELPEKVHKILDERTDPSWPTIWFTPRLTDTGPCSSVYGLMASWGANHAGFAYGHIGTDLITLASMLRIPVSLHNLPECALFRPHSWSAFGTDDLEGADYRACKAFGPLYK